MRRRGLLVALILVLGPAGCAGAEKEPPPDTTAVTERMQDDLSGRPEVVYAKVVYQNSFSNPRRADASVMIEPGADPGPVADEIVRMFWVSELSPLQGVSLSVWDEKDDERNDIRRLDFEDAATRADLEKKYGPRP